MTRGRYVEIEKAIGFRDRTHGHRESVKAWFAERVGRFGPDAFRVFENGLGKDGRLFPAP